MDNTPNDLPRLRTFYMIGVEYGNRTIDDLCDRILPEVSSAHPIFVPPPNRRRIMHPKAADAIVSSVQRREEQGDCPIEPMLPYETLELCILELASRSEQLRATLDEICIAAGAAGWSPHAPIAAFITEQH